MVETWDTTLVDAQRLCSDTRAWLQADEHTETELQQRLLELVKRQAEIKAMSYFATGALEKRIETVTDDLDDIAETIAFGLSADVRADINAALRSVGIVPPDRWSVA